MKNNTSTHYRPIWAPWRIDYIRSEKNTDCFICQKALDRSDDLKNLILARGKYAYVLFNEFPYTSGHLMVTPYSHIADICELTKKESIEMVELTVRSVKVMRKVLNPQGFNIGYNLGECSGAGLKDHIHQHIVPRWNGDTNFMPVLANTRVVPEALIETCQLLRDAFE